MQETNILRKIRAYIMKKMLFHLGSWFSATTKGTGCQSCGLFQDT